MVSISINLLSLEIFALRFLQSRSVLSCCIEQVILRKAHIITMHALFGADGGEVPRGAYSGKCTMMMSPAIVQMTRIFLGSAMLSSKCREGISLQGAILEWTISARKD